MEHNAEKLKHNLAQTNQQSDTQNGKNIYVECNLSEKGAAEGASIYILL